MRLRLSTCPLRPSAASASTTSAFHARLSHKGETYRDSQLWRGPRSICLQLSATPRLGRLITDRRTGSRGGLCNSLHARQQRATTDATALPDAELRRLAQFIAKELDALHGLEPALLTAADVAKQYGLSRGWVYKHSRDLGGQRMGTGPKARLRFRAREVQARLSDLQASEDEMPRLERSGTRQPVELLPIGPTRSSRQRALTDRARDNRPQDPLLGADRSHAPPPG